MQDPKNQQKFAIWAPLHKFVGLGPISLQLRHLSTITKKLVKQQYLLHMSSQYGELQPTNGWDRFTSLGHPCKFQWFLRLGSITARHSSSGRQLNLAALNRGHHLYSAGPPSRWALAHILVIPCYQWISVTYLHSKFNTLLIKKNVDL